MKDTILRNIALLTVLAVALTGGLAAVGCSDDNDPPDALYTTWQLQEFVLDDGTVIPVDDPAKYTVTFNTDGTANIQADCNTCNGPFSADEDSLSFGLMACTLAACGAGSFDTQFQMALSTVSSYTIDGPLFLDYEGGVMRLTPVPTLF